MFAESSIQIHLVVKYTTPQFVEGSGVYAEQGVDGNGARSRSPGRTSNTEVDLK